MRNLFWTWRVRGGAWTDTPLPPWEGSQLPWPVSQSSFLHQTQTQHGPEEGKEHSRRSPNSRFLHGYFQYLFFGFGVFFFAFRVFTSVFKITSDAQSPVVYSSGASSCLLEIEMGNKQNRKCPSGCKNSCGGRMHADGSFLGWNCPPTSFTCSWGQRPVCPVRPVRACRAASTPGNRVPSAGLTTG